MSKLLYLVHRIPFPPNKGDKIRSFNFLKALVKEHDIYLGFFIDDPIDQQYVDELRSYCKELFFININKNIQKVKSLIGLLKNDALSVPYYFYPEFQNWVDETIKLHEINKVLIFSSPMAQYVEKYSDMYRAADFIDVDSDKWLQYAQNKKWPASYIYNRESRKLLEFERRIAKQFDITFFVSEKESDLFKELAPESQEKISYINNGVDTEFFDPSLSFPSPYAGTAQVMVFTGAMDYWANINAVEWFARQVFPLIQKQHPDALFYIVGANPTAQVQILAEENPAIIVTGRVDDIRSYLAHAQVVVAPLRIARGIQNKVLEAMAFSKAIVATSMAIEGIPVTSDLATKIADEPNDFADAVISYLNFDDANAISSRAFVQSEFGWVQCEGRFHSIFK